MIKLLFEDLIEGLEPMRSPMIFVPKNIALISICDVFPIEAPPCDKWANPNGAHFATLFSDGY